MVQFFGFTLMGRDADYLYIRTPYESGGFSRQIEHRKADGFQRIIVGSEQEAGSLVRYLNDGGQMSGVPHSGVTPRWLSASLLT